MTAEELASELYELIVNKGRHKGRPRPFSIFNGTNYADLPDWMQEMWKAKAVEFAAQNNFELED